VALNRLVRNPRSEWPGLSYRPSVRFSLGTLVAGLSVAAVGLTVSAFAERLTAVIACGVVIAFLAWRMIRIRCPRCGHRLLYHERRWVGELPMECLHCGLDIRQSWRR